MEGEEERHTKARKKLSFFSTDVPSTSEDTPSLVPTRNSPLMSPPLPWHKNIERKTKVVNFKNFENQNQNQSESERLGRFESCSLRVPIDSTIYDIKVILYRVAQILSIPINVKIENIKLMDAKNYKLLSPDKLPHVDDETVLFVYYDSPVSLFHLTYDLNINMKSKNLFFLDTNVIIDYATSKVNDVPLSENESKRLNKIGHTLDYKRQNCHLFYSQHVGEEIKFHLEKTTTPKSVGDYIRAIINDQSPFQSIMVEYDGRRVRLCFELFYNSCLRGQQYKHNGKKSFSTLDIYPDVDRLLLFHQPWYTNTLADFAIVVESLLVCHHLQTNVLLLTSNNDLYETIIALRQEKLKWIQVFSFVFPDDVAGWYIDKPLNI